MFRIIFAILLVPSICFGANYYVDPTYNGSNGSSNGSYSRPWTTIAEVNRYSFSTGDGLYFKVGTRLVMTEPLSIGWNGSAEKRAVVGAYFGKDQFGLDGSDRPILDGNNWMVPPRDSYQGLIQHKNRSGYVTIQDLKVLNSGKRGISLGNSSNVPYPDTFNIVRNCEVYRPWGSGIVVERASHNLIENNIVTATSYRQIVTGERTMGGGY